MSAALSFVFITNQINNYAYRIFMPFGIIGNLLIIILLSRQRQNACALYLISSAAINNIHLLFTGFVYIFPVDYSDQSIGKQVMCKMQMYIPSCTGQIPKMLLILACIDRYLITSENAHYRALSTSRRAKYLIVFNIILWAIIPIYVPILTTIQYGQCIPTGIYGIILAVYSIVVVGLLPSIALIVFSSLTLRNRRQFLRRTRTTRNDTNHKMQRRERDLSILVIFEVVFYILCAALYPLIQLEMVISQYAIGNETYEQLQIEFSIFQISILLLYIYSASTFYIYLLAAKSFRQDFVKLIKQIFRMTTTIEPFNTSVTH